MMSFRTLIISIAVHIGLLILLSKLAGPVQIRNTRPVFIEFHKSLSTEDRKDLEKRNSIVRNTHIPLDELTSIKQKARFVSEEERNVIQEQRAAHNGLTMNRAGQLAQAQKPQQESHEKSENGHKQDHETQRTKSRPTQRPPESMQGLKPPSLSERIASGDIEVGRQDTDQKQSASRSNLLSLPLVDPRQQGASTVGEELPKDLRVGSFTALNTDRYLYYSFYARVEEQVRHRWVKYVRAVLYSYHNSHPRAGGETWISTIQILLDKKGNFVKGVVRDPSGVKGLDLAPIHAFREAAQIPNPPAEMAKEDGLIHLDYQFFVHNQPSSLFAHP